MQTEINIKLLPAQKAFVNSSNPFPAIVGGLGSGKSRAGTLRVVLNRLKAPGTNGLYCMPTYDLIKLRAMPGVQDDLDLIGINYTVNKSDYSISIENYGTIYFRSYERPERIVSFEVADAILDELDTLPKEKARIVWRKVTERVRENSPIGNSIGNVTTPDMGVNGFTYERWVKRGSDKYELIKASTYDNIYLPESYIEQIKDSYDDVLADLYLNGEFVSLSGKKVYHFFDRINHHSDRTITGDDKEIHIGTDFNIGGCVSIAFVIDNGNPIAVDEFISHDSQDIHNNIIHRYKGKRVYFYPDASGDKNTTNATASDIAIVTAPNESVKFVSMANRKNPFVRDRINSVNGLMAHNKFKINTDKCPELTFSIESQGYDKQGKPEKFNDHPAIDDYCDAFGYFIQRRYPVKKPIGNIDVSFNT